MKRLDTLSKNLVRKYKYLQKKNKGLEMKLELEIAKKHKKRPNDLLTIKDIINQYDLSRKTVDRMRKYEGLGKKPVSNKKEMVWIKREDLEKHLYDRPSKNNDK